MGIGPVDPYSKGGPIAMLAAYRALGTVIEHDSTAKQLLDSTTVAGIQQSEMKDVENLFHQFSSDIT